jgi:multiple sugar transport system substrate-binding protein
MTYQVGRYTRRAVLKRAGGAAVALSASSAFLAACGGGSSGASGGKPSSLDAFWWGDPGAMPEWLDQSIAAFKEKTGTDIKVAEQETTNLIPNFTAAAAAKSGPSLAAQWATQPVLAQAWAEAVEPLDGLVPESERSHWQFTEENLYGGKLWAMPMYVMGAPICLNKKIFESAGLDPENPPATWDDFVNTCKTLKSKGITPLGIGNKDTFGGRWAFAFNASTTTTRCRSTALAAPTCSSRATARWRGRRTRRSSTGARPWVRRT